MQEFNINAIYNYKNKAVIGNASELRNLENKRRKWVD